MSDQFISIYQSGEEQLLEKAVKDGAETMWDRKAAQKTPCGFGEKGVCCRICAMGPCRVSPVAGKGAQKGICGATADVIVARNYARMVAAGTAAHSDHARDIAHILHMASRDGNYKVRDEKKLMSLAKEWGVNTENRDIYEIAHEVAEIALNEFGKPFGTLKFLERAPELRQKVWEDLQIKPRAIDREIATILHSTHVGCTGDAESLVHMSMRTSLADGWGGSMIGTEFSDIIFGTPVPRETEANLGVLDEKQVNIILHGHEPSLSEMIVMASLDPEMQKLAKEVGAEGINLAGMCCTGNEVTMRHGVKIAGNFYQQEMAILTGAVEAIIVDVQCIFPALAKLSDCYHTKFITTSPKAKITGATHIEFHEDNAMESAKNIVKEAIENFKNRKNEKVFIPEIKSNAVVGYSVEAVIKQLDKVVNPHIDPMGTVKPLADVIKAGVLRGAVGIVGCNNPKSKHDYSHIEIMKKLIANDVIVVTTGCAAQAAAKAGLLTKDARKLAGQGLATVCELVDIPPVLHMGSCVDISRILTIVGEVAKHLGIDNSDLPVAGIAPEWMSEKAVAIATYVISSGIDTFLGITPPVTGSDEVVDILTNRVENMTGAKFFIEEDPHALADKVLGRIEEKRQKLGI
ncbi:anaerobic carbon-monoxide dehydrogenase catalytic subunit [Geosporobacter ferrireducens]|uniref:Carbon monoxide dehydrogenase n=1 Tax=Geosporobacter ferrireducens TaxID=1424294 RepID=A0A1D8GE93_9FIRM|nr:anaerobic carbon-monoxide dehydrogenase catalytic subunit [Geosporobacter ferrireducens]AOT69222.1 carbon-monoxide dehydrogenase catalytic subunit [Geosporobacter ferrireducens]MTI56902.1 anaerobic carbon-monoxide dehydrogenase catalytic subunit [Geosporobacter ferrireducens]